MRPGDTPPDSGSTSGLSHPQPMRSRAVPIWFTVLIGLFVLCVLGMVIAQTVGLIDVLW
ncbi:hypothetical protein SAMN05661093_08837 [Kibdelosporangium aridum]|uniref:Uncharacterized protein n=1 Tax=Kibdelosporangium aridum TaxID=2030 RepID=A0A1W2FTC8_KIBAR|nr:hypothetical protein SAMN05661093_08837 [Kibdelosporangium aridum]